MCTCYKLVHEPLRDLLVGFYVFYCGKMVLHYILRMVCHHPLTPNKNGYKSMSTAVLSNTVAISYSCLLNT